MLTYIMEIYKALVIEMAYLAVRAKRERWNSQLIFREFSLLWA